MVSRQLNGRRLFDRVGRGCLFAPGELRTFRFANDADPIAIIEHPVWNGEFKVDWPYRYSASPVIDTRRHL
jgi:hypothetical protein